MVTNTKEYMREYQAKRRAKIKDSLQDNVKKGVKNVKNKMLDISLERLKRPRAPTENEIRLKKAWNKYDASASGEITIESSLATKFTSLDSGYQKWALSLETQRHYYYTKFGKVHRKNSIEVKKDLRVKNQELDMVELMKRDKAGLYRDCMTELKEVLELRKK